MEKLLSKIKQNWKSGITVSLISLPLSVSLAVASGASPVQGIITAVWAGIIASIFGGSNYNIIGPTGALSGILASYAISLGVNSLAVLAILSGAIILIAQILKLEKYIVLVPASAIHGFTLGVAFIIGLNQLNFALGLSSLEVHEKFIENVLESLKHINDFSITAVVIFLIFLISLFLFKKFLPKVPGAIVLAPIGILIGFLASSNILPFEVQTLALKYPEISPTLFNFPKLDFNLYLVIPAFTISLIAILETMISAKIADGMTKTKYNKRKEMFGLGLANIVSGIMGGLPATAALARTSLNIKSGATDRISATISSIFIVIISFIFLSYFKYIPLPVIAAILVYVAIQMIEFQHFSRMLKIDKRAFVISIIVAAITIIEDPITGILIGVVISLLLLVEEMTKGQFEIVLNGNKKMIGHITDDEIQDINEKTDTLVYSIKGHLNYINGQSHIARFETKLNGHKNIILRLREVYFMDLDGIEAFDEIIGIIKKNKRNIFVTGVSPLLEPILRHSAEYNKLKKQKLTFHKTGEALLHLGYNI